MIPKISFVASTDFECINMVCSISDRIEGNDHKLGTIRNPNTYKVSHHMLIQHRRLSKSYVLMTNLIPIGKYHALQKQKSD